MIIKSCHSAAARWRTVGRWTPGKRWVISTTRLPGHSRGGDGGGVT